MNGPPRSWSRVGWAVVAIGLVAPGPLQQGAEARPGPASGPALALSSTTGEAPSRREQVLVALLERIERDPVLRSQADLHLAIAAQLDQERTALREASRTRPLATDAGTAADLLMLIGLQLVPHATAETRPVLLSALVRGFYAPDSRFAADLALYGEAIADDLLSLTRDASPAHRANAYALIGRVLNNNAAGALAETLEVDVLLGLVNGLRSGLDDDEASVRVVTVDALAASGDSGSLRRLADLARRDVSPLVRQRARDAVATLAPER